MLPASLVQSACEIIEAARPVLVDAILADLYKNTFWHTRYQNTGQEYARSVAHYHLNSLIAAIKTGDPNIFADHWAWDRPVMVMRGACTHHMHEFIDSTARAVAQVLHHDFLLVEPSFAAAHRALDYEQPYCRALSQVRETLIERISQRVCPDAARLDAYRRWSRYHLSYLEDAAAMSKPEVFRNFEEWVRDRMLLRGESPSKLSDGLRVVAEELERALPPEMAAEFGPSLRAAQAAIAAG